MSTEPLAYTIAQIVEMKLLPLSKKQITRQIKLGRLRALHTGHMYIVPRAALDEWLQLSDEPAHHPDSFPRSA